MVSEVVEGPLKAAAADFRAAVVVGISEEEVAVVAG